MNRLITFRGKRVDNGEWVYGYIWICPAKCWIVNVNEEGEAELNLVDPETVGQYTGLKDKNGVEIYEGDICTTKYFTGVVEWRDNGYAINVEDDVWTGLMGYREVIGNIYEHPHLIGGESDGN